MVQHTISLADNGRNNVTIYTKEPNFVTVAS